MNKPSSEHQVQLEFIGAEIGSHDGYEIDRGARDTTRLFLHYDGKWTAHCPYVEVDGDSPIAAYTSYLVKYRRKLKESIKRLEDDALTIDSEIRKLENE